MEWPRGQQGLVFVETRREHTGRRCKDWCVGPTRQTRGVALDVVFEVLLARAPIAGLAAVTGARVVEDAGVAGVAVGWSFSAFVAAVRPILSSVPLEAVVGVAMFHFVAPKAGAGGLSNTETSSRWTLGVALCRRCGVFCFSDNSNSAGAQQGPQGLLGGEGQVQAILGAGCRTRSEISWPRTKSKWWLQLWSERSGVPEHFWLAHWEEDEPDVDALAVLETQGLGHLHVCSHRRGDVKTSPKLMFLLVLRFAKNWTSRLFHFSLKTSRFGRHIPDVRTVCRFRRL